MGKKGVVDVTDFSQQVQAPQEIITLKMVAQSRVSMMADATTDEDMCQHHVSSLLGDSVGRRSISRRPLHVPLNDDPLADSRQNSGADA